jgi:hypothetical protein
MNDVEHKAERRCPFGRVKSVFCVNHKIVGCDKFMSIIKIAVWHLKRSRSGGAEGRPLVKARNDKSVALMTNGSFSSAQQPRTDRPSLSG